MEDGPFDRNLRRVRRDRAARTGERADYLRTIVVDELVDRLSSVKRDFTDALLLGGGHPGLAEHLRAMGARVTSADSSFTYARREKGVQCDEDRLPFRDGAFDLIISGGTLDSVNDLPGALTLIRRALRPDGMLLAAFAGAGSLIRLKSAMLAADMESSDSVSPRIHPQIDVRGTGDLLVRAGFNLPVVDTHPLTIRFPGIDALIGDLRALGATNILAARSRHPLSRRGYAAATADFDAHADADGKTAEQIEIIHLIAWAPAPSQPKPAQRGSGTQSLTQALARRPEPGHT